MKEKELSLEKNEKIINETSKKSQENYEGFLSISCQFPYWIHDKANNVGPVVIFEREDPL